jgi:para-nitrobenzyl esterase
LATATHAAWVAFATNGDPNNENLPAWPRYNPQTRPTMLLDETSRVVDDPAADEVALWDGLL